LLQLLKPSVERLAVGALDLPRRPTGGRAPLSGHAAFCRPATVLKNFSVMRKFSMTTAHPMPTTFMCKVLEAEGKMSRDDDRPGST
jgi:hypothetical protein